MGIKKVPKEKNIQQEQNPDYDGIQQDTEGTQESYDPSNESPLNPNYYQLGNENPGHEEHLRRKANQQALEPLKKQLQGQLVSFQKEIQRLQNQQKEMLKKYNQEVEQISKQKRSVISDIKSDHENEFKKQIDQLQKKIDQMNKQQYTDQNKSSPKQKNPKQQLTVQTPLKKGSQQEQKSGPLKSLNTSQQKKKIELKKIQSPRDNSDADYEEDEKLPNEMAQKYNNSSQIIITPINNQQKKVQTPKSAFQKHISKLNKEKSLAQIMQGNNQQDLQEEETQNSLQSRKSFKNKMQIATQSQESNNQNSLNPDQNIQKRNTLPPKKAPTQTSSISQQNQINPLVPMNADNEPLSITNLLKRMKSNDKMEEPIKPNQQYQLEKQLSQNPSILRKESSFQRKLSGAHSQKSVRILDQSNNNQFQAEQNNSSYQELQQNEQIQRNDNEFNLGKDVPLITDEIGTEYVQQSRDLEKQFYQDVLKPHVIKQNIQSHSKDRISDNDNYDIPQSIGGIKISGVEKTIAQQPTLQLEEKTQDLASKFTNFLFNKGLISNNEDLDENNKNQIEEELVIEKVQPSQQSQKMQQQQFALNQEANKQAEYTLGEKSYNDDEGGSFNDYEVSAKQIPEMNQQLTDIKRIINENTKMSEDFNNKWKEQTQKGYIQFNKSFEKNLKAVGDMFLEDKRKQSQGGGIQTLVNISRINQENEEEKFDEQDFNNNNYQVKQPNNKQSTDNYYTQKDQNYNNQKSGDYPIRNFKIQQQTEETDDDQVNLEYGIQPNLLSKYNEEAILPQYENQFEDIDDFGYDNQQMMNAGTPKQFHLLNYLMSNKQQQQQDTFDSHILPYPNNNLGGNTKEVQRQFHALDTRSQFSHLDEQSPQHFSKILKKQIKPQNNPNNQSSFESIQLLSAKTIEQPKIIPRKVQNKQIQNQRNNQFSPMKQLIQQDSLALQHPTMQMILTEDQQEKQQQFKKPPLPVPTNKIPRAMQPLSNNFNNQQQQILQTPLRPDTAATGISGPFNLFTENSHINDHLEYANPPLVSLYNPNLFREDPPPNKIYDKRDPFLLSLNLRQKLSETNQMIYTDNQNLLDKIKLLGKSIKPVQYGTLPYIDLTKQSNGFQQNDDLEKEDARFRSELYTVNIRNNLQEYLPMQISANQDQTSIDIADRSGLNNSSLKYLNYNFNGERGLDIKERMMQQDQLEKEKSKQKQLLKFASSFNNELVTDIVKGKIQESQRSISNNNQQRQLKQQQQKQVNNYPQLMNQRITEELSNEDFSDLNSSNKNNYHQQVSNLQFQSQEEEYVSESSQKQQNYTQHLRIIDEQSNQNTFQQSKSQTNQLRKDIKTQISHQGENQKFDNFSQKIQKNPVINHQEPHLKSLDSFFSDQTPSKQGNPNFLNKQYSNLKQSNNDFRTSLLKVQTAVMTGKSNQDIDEQFLFSKVAQKQNVFATKSAGISTPQHLFKIENASMNNDFEEDPTINQNSNNDQMTI